MKVGGEEAWLRVEQPVWENKREAFNSGIAWRKSLVASAIMIMRENLKTPNKSKEEIIAVGSSQAVRNHPVLKPSIGEAPSVHEARTRVIGSETSTPNLLH